MRSHPFLTGALIRVPSILCLGILTQLTLSAIAAPSCSGDACDVVSISADGCNWRNNSPKAIRFRIFNNTETLMSTVLGAGESFKQTKQAACLTSTPSSPQLEATFAALRQMPDAPDFTLKAKPQTPAAIAGAPVAIKVAMPRPKPAPSVAPVEAVTPAAAPQAVVAVASAKPLPRSKPPAPLTTEATTPRPTSVAMVQPAIPMPTQAEIDAGANPCGDACSEILFKAVDNCLWVQSQNPKPIMFQATIAGHMAVLLLEGASYEKTASAPASSSAAYHTRQRDPFQSSSPGIPVYRARLDDKGSCVTGKNQISQFVAVYKK